MDKLIQALTEILASVGLDAETIDAVVGKLSAIAEDESDEENTVEVAPTTDEPTTDEVPPLPPEPTDEGNGETQSDEPSPDEVEATEEVPPVPTEEVTPVEPTPDVVPPVEEPQPPFDPSPLLSAIEELQKANEGLIARVESLEEALRVAGVLDGENPATQVGDPNPSQTPQNPTNDVFNDVLRELNGNKRR